jgi:Holliday junction resolvasome RuvABC DNA-binding subunit
MEAVKKHVHGRFFAALKQMPGATKEDIVAAYTNGKTTSLSDFYYLNERGCRQMVSDLELKVKTLNTVSKLQTDKIIKQKRSAILKRLQKHGVDTTDWRKVNAFLEQPKIAGKRLYEMTIDEMQALIAKLESILQKDKIYKEKIINTANLN